MRLQCRGTVWGAPYPPAVWYQYSPGRGGEYPRKHLKNYAGTLQVDGYAGFEALLEFIFSLGSGLTIDTRSSQQVWLAYSRILLSSGNASEAAEWAAKAYEAGTHTDDPASPVVVAAKTALNDARAAHQFRT